MPQEKAGQLHPSWQAVIGDEFNKPYMQALPAFLQQEKAIGEIICPPHLITTLKLKCTKLKTKNPVIAGFFHFSICKIAVSYGA